VSSVGTAARDVGSILKRAKTPLLAGGAALAGVAGGLALRARGNHRGGALSNFRNSLPGNSNGLNLRRGGFKRGVRQLSKSVSEVAERADRIGQGVSKAANTVQKVSDTANDAAKKA
jgi:methyl-accepting chemotaxis protein